jgi:hypothetical protein
MLPLAFEHTLILSSRAKLGLGDVRASAVGDSLVWQLFTSLQESSAEHLRAKFMSILLLTRKHPGFI